MASLYAKFKLVVCYILKPRAVVGAFSFPDCVFYKVIKLVALSHLSLLH